MNGPEKFEIRQALPGDAGALLAIYAPYVLNTAVSFECTLPTVEEFRNRIESTVKEYPYLVCEMNGKIAGYCYASSFHSREAYRHCVETSVYVARDCRGLGIGSALYAELEQRLIKQNVFTLYACVTCTDREDEYLSDASLLFHDRMGYKQVGFHENCGYKFDRWYSVKWLEKRIAERPLHPGPFIPLPLIK